MLAAASTIASPSGRRENSLGLLAPILGNGRTIRSRGFAPGSRRAANSANRFIQWREISHRDLSEVHEQSEPMPNVAHVVALELARHAGGRGFESRRSRSSAESPDGPQIGTSSSSRPVAEGSWKNAGATERKAVTYNRRETP
jgi:hypothetical protein